MTKAKAAFAAGKKLFDAGDFAEAAAKFKESYKLSKNPVLLYNIGFANEKAGQDDIALFYYRKFLTDAPADAAQRGEVTDKVAELELKFRGGATPTPTPTPGPTVTTPTPTPTRTEPIKIKPAGTYKEADFQHQAVDTAPPKKPLDITAFVPEDSGWTVTLNYRTAGEGKFTSKEMKWRYKELVGRVPAQKMLGESMQYYIEVKDQSGATVAKAGKSTSPNLVTLEPGASPRFYPDFTDEGTVVTPQETVGDDTEEDPLTGKKKTPKKIAVVPGDDGTELEPTPTGGQGLTTPGSKKFKIAKWSATGTAGGMILLSVIFNVQAGNFATALEDESSACGAPPCGSFDDYNKGLQSSGQLRETLSNVTLVVGIGATAVAGYFWYKELTSKKPNTERMSGRKPAAPVASWTVVPTVGDGANGFMGAAAAGRF
ncbi:MAG: hypothetical protein H0T42_24225 [Deltaproteobacteria bacterium]|nr:hypothetical protein [Deltaproteobacteria bacterium]